MKNLLLIPVVLILLSSCSQDNQKLLAENEMLKRELEYYRNYDTPLLSYEDSLFYSQIEIERKQYEDSLKLAFVIKPDDGKSVKYSEIESYRKSCNEFKKFKKGVRHWRWRKRNVSLSDSFYFGINTLTDMVEAYNKYNDGAGEGIIKGVGMRLYKKNKARNGKPTHSDIVLFPVKENGDPIYETEIDGSFSITTDSLINILKDVPPYNSSTPCPTC